MNRNTALSAIIVGGAALAAAGAIAMNSGFDPFQEYADVVSVEPAFETTQTPRIVCGNDVAPDAESPGDGAIPQCQAVMETIQVESGFDVTYELDGDQRVVRMDRDPGPRIPVEDGELVLSQS